MLKKKTRFLALTCDRLETSKIPTVNFWYMKLLCAGNNSRRFLGEKFPVETLYRKFTAFCCFTNKFPLFEDLRLKQPLLAYSDSCTSTATSVCCNANHPHSPNISGNFHLPQRHVSVTNGNLGQETRVRSSQRQHLLDSIQVKLLRNSGCRPLVSCADCFFDASVTLPLRQASQRAL